MGLHWDLPLMPYDWQNDREYADPVPDVLGAADDARTTVRERGLAEPGESRVPGEADREPAVNPPQASEAQGASDRGFEPHRETQANPGSASPPSFEWAVDLARREFAPKGET